MQKKMKLENLSVESFVTQKGGRKVEGGAAAFTLTTITLTFYPCF